MILTPMTLEYAEIIRRWRNQDIRPWRTPYMLTKEMQRDYYNNVLCDRNSNSREWALVKYTKFLGVVALRNIEWENGLAEIGLHIGPEYSGRGYGQKAVELVLDQAFHQLNLHQVYGECYFCNPALGFWEKMCERFDAYTTTLPDRKFADGCYWHSLYFSFGRRSNDE